VRHALHLPCDGLPCSLQWASPKRRRPTALASLAVLAATAVACGSEFTVSPFPAGAGGATSSATETTLTVGTAESATTANGSGGAGGDATATSATTTNSSSSGGMSGSTGAGTGGAPNGFVVPEDCKNCFLSHCVSRDVDSCFTTAACLSSLLCVQAKCQTSAGYDLECAYYNCFMGNDEFAALAMNDLGCIEKDCQTQCGSLLKN